MIRLGGTTGQPRHDETPRTSDDDEGHLSQAGAIVVDGRGPMGLRGGGPHPAAGVLRWLYESDEEYEVTPHYVGAHTGDMRPHEPCADEGLDRGRASVDRAECNQEEETIGGHEHDYGCIGDITYGNVHNDNGDLSSEDGGGRCAEREREADERERMRQQDGPYVISLAAALRVSEDGRPPPG